MGQFIQSPNYNKGRGGKKPEIIVLHIMEGTYDGSIAWFKNPKSQVSSHYLVSKAGAIMQMVNEADTAWTNGRVVNPSSKIVKQLGGNPNQYSLTIEHEGKFSDVWPEAMKKASVELIKHFAEKWNIPIDRDHIIGHYEIYASKPNCPAKNKAIIDELIQLAKPIIIEEPMTKELKAAYKRLTGEDPGDNLNDGEERKLASAINKVLDTPASNNSAEITSLKTQIETLTGERNEALAQGEKNASIVAAFKLFWDKFNS